MDSGARRVFVSYSRAVSVPLLNTDDFKWPIGSGRAGAKCVQELSDSVVDEVTSIAAIPGGCASVGALFRNPTRIWRMSHHLLRSMKQSGVPKAAIQNVMLSLAQIVESMKYGDAFNSDGYNMLLSPAEIAALLRDRRLRDADNEYSAALHSLCGVLWAYSEALYFVAHECSTELHGLYRFGGSNMLIRDYINLRPDDLWPGRHLVGHDEIRVIADYDSTVDLEFDVYNNHYMKAGGFVRNLLRGAALCDGVEVDSTSGLRDLASEVAEATQEIVSFVEQLDEEEIALKYVDIFWYRKKPFCDFLGRSWRPPQSVRERIVSEGIPPEKPPGSKDPEEIYRLLDLL